MSPGTATAATAGPNLRANGESPPGERQRPGVVNTGAAEGDWAGNLKSGSTIAAAADALTHLQRQVGLEAVLDAWGATWERRARALEAARPRPEDFHGQASRDELDRRWHGLSAAARACRARAQVSPLELILPDVDNVLEEAS